MTAATRLGLTLLLVGGCGPFAPPAAPPRTQTIDATVRAGQIGERAARFDLGAPLPGELRFDLPRCEWAGIGAVRVDRVCVGSFTLRTARGTLRGAARALWSGYRQLLALHGEVRVGTGCFAAVAGGAVHRDGPVSFPALPVRVTLTLPAGTACLPDAGLHAEALARAALAADAAASAIAVEVLARALADPRDEVREAAAVALGFTASDPLYGAFRAALHGVPSLLAQAERSRELRTPGGGSPSACDGGEPDDPELQAVCAAGRRGFDPARATLVAALRAASRPVRREAALLLVRLGGARARPPLEVAARRAQAAGDLATAVDLAEALLAAPAR